MPLLSEFSVYSEWGNVAKMWGKTLYSHPITSVIDYSAANLCASLNKTDFESGGHLKYKMRSKVEENEEDLNNGVVFEPITAEWMFNILKARHPKPAGQPIMRVANQLNNLNDAIWKELG